jgi:uncharacterized protein (TIGR04168 family)
MEVPQDRVRIAVVGDVHLAFDKRDVALLDAAGYDLVLFVGDLAGYGRAGGLRVARRIARLRTPTLVLPGNHDAVTVQQLAAEVFDVPERLRSFTAIGMQRRADALARALEPVPMCGYSLHAFDALGLSVLAARPHSLGGARLGFRRYLARRFGAGTMQLSAAKLCELFDGVPSGRPIIVLAHCGPAGLGDTRAAIFGCDFRAEAGDWGDPDLETALSHAKSTGKTVLAVVAGHMHHALRGGGERRWQLQRDGVQYLNAARVPRTRVGPTGHERHHVKLIVSGGELVSAEQVWLSASAQRSAR